MPDTLLDVDRGLSKLMRSETPDDIESAAKAQVKTIALRSGGCRGTDLQGFLAFYNNPADLCARFDSLLFMSMTTKNNVMPEKSDVLFPLPGKLCEQFIRCGKPGCRCQDGERHGPYYYRIWREGNHVQKVYVKREELEAVKAACDSYKSYTTGLREMRVMRLRLSRRITGECRRAQRLLR